MTELGSPTFPVAKDDDDDDVAWALSTAHVQWKRGSQADAVVWLRRAIDAAVTVGATWRAAELTRQTDTLEAYLVSGPVAAAVSLRAPVSGQGQVAIDDFDGTDIIDEEAMSLPPDADMTPSLRAPLSGDSTDELTDVTPDDEQIAAEVEAAVANGEEEIVEIAEDDISDDDLDDDLSERAEADAALPRFASEAPTANFPSPSLRDLERSLEPDPDPQPEPEPTPEPDSEPVQDTEPESEIPDTVSERIPDTLSQPEPELPPAYDDDPSPTPVRLSVADAVAIPEPEDEPQPEPELPPVSSPSEPFVAGISLAEIAGFEDFPPETQFALAKQARVERLATEEEVSGFGLALVLRGAVSVMPAIADVTCGAAGERELVYGRGTLQEGVTLRLVATAPDTQVAIWSFDVIEPALAACPWVLDELQSVADRYQALAGVSMGPMGDRLDDALRDMVLSRCRLVRLLPGEVLVEKGKPVGGLFIVGAGRLELGSDGGASEGELGPGDFLFAAQVLAGGAAPTAARAGASGALLMAADRHAAHELMLSVPPLLELLAG